MQTHAIFVATLFQAAAWPGCCQPFPEPAANNATRPAGQTMTVVFSKISSGTIEVWLAAHHEITVVSRDRGGGYGPAATKSAPQAAQVADRWHPMKNVSAAFLEAVRRPMRPLSEQLE